MEKPLQFLKKREALLKWRNYYLTNNQEKKLNTGSRKRFIFAA